MSIVEFLSQPLWQRLGLTLVHFLWQGLAVAVLVGMLVRVFRLNHGNIRYAAYLLAFVAMIACPVVTFTTIDIPLSPNTKLVAEIQSAEAVDSSSYTILPVGDILPEAETSTTSANSIPLSQRISDWLNVSMPWVLVIWMVGVIVLSGRLLMGFVGIYRWRNHLEPLPERLAQRVTSLSEGLGMRNFSRVFISPAVLQAMAVGYLRPMVLLPAAMVTQMQPEMLEAVIAHELAHIRRFDLWINLAQRVTETLLFYHPAVWWLSNCIRSERELCCDELAVKATGERITYATTLESVGQASFMAKQPILAAGLGQDNKPTLSRVRHILGMTPTQRNCPFWLAGVIAVVFLAGLTIPTTLALTSRTNEQADLQEKKGQKELSKFKKTLANGVTIELIGICEYPSASKQWWRPDGSRLEGKITTIDKSNYKSEYPGYEIAFKISGQDYNFIRGSIKGSKESSNLNVIKPEGISAHRAHIKPGISKTKIGAAAAAGKWKTVASHAGYGTTFRDVKSGKIIFSAANESKGGLVMTVSDDTDRKTATRLVAIDKKGLEHTGKIQTSLSVNKMRQQTFAFSNVLLDDIKEFAFQTRPYEYVTFKNVLLKPNFKPDAQVKNDDIHVYQVNRKVSDFSEAEDFSTPESAYAAINRVMAGEDWYAWQRVSVKRLAKGLAKDAKRRQGTKTDPEWSRVVLNARILEVRMKDDHAVVIAELPQKLSSKPIKEPIDYRHLEFEDGKWLNTGENRYDTIEQAREKFTQTLEKQSTEAAEQLKIEQKYTEALEKPDMLLNFTEELFEKIRNADYDKILSYYNEQTGKWKWDGWKKLISEKHYMTKTNFPGMVKWICENFKENPIVSVELGKVFVSEKEFSWVDRKSWPAVPYKVVLKDGGILEGDLLFQYRPERKRPMFRTREAYWEAMLGFDWHLQDEPIRKAEIQSTDSSSAPQILTSGYILSVPADLPQLKEIISDDKSKAKMITPEKLEEFLASIDKTPGARVIAAPKLLTNDGEVGEIRTKNAVGFESIKLNIKNSVGTDRKTVTVEVDFECRYDEEDNQVKKGVYSTVSTLSDHAFAIACNEVKDKQMVILLVKPKILERQFSKTGVVQTESPTEQADGFKQKLEEPVTVHIEHSPENDKLSVQYAVMAICKAAGVPYNWDKSAKLADPYRRSYINPVHIENNIASQAIADMVGPAGLLYGVDADGVYLYKPEKAGQIQSNLQIHDIELEPVAQGKNILFATVKNTSNKEQLFAIHIYTRSVDYGSQGVGWGTNFFEKIMPNETKRTRFVYKIQGPVTENTYVRVKFYNPATEEDYNYDKPFAVRVFKSNDLPKPEVKTVTRQWTDEEMSEEIFKTFKNIQTLIKKKDYEKIWGFFTEDYQKSEYQSRGLEGFKLHMEPENPLHAAFHWDKKTFVMLKRKRLEASTDNLNDKGAKLTAEYKNKKWIIYFVYDPENNKWKIDDILGYQPAILDMQEADNR